ncbi:MAG TPA: hypothetical protein VK638_49100 [Edaphobacter sp.]|nr:hypothetical protein [Edaphobacter sp.]
MKGRSVLSKVSPRRGEPIRFSHGLLGLLRSASSGTIRLVIAAVAVTWIPPAILAAFHGLDSLRSFLVDYAAQSRLLVVIPLLILAEPPLVARLARVARHFRDAGLIKEVDLPRFASALSDFMRRGDSRIVRVVLVLLVFLLGSVMSVDRSSSLMPWCVGAGGVANLSRAGSWYIMVSLPIVLYILLRWVWRQLLWLWFLGITSRMDLQLIPSHPDQAGGLSFVEHCMRGYLPFGFAIGTIFAGAVANRVVYLHQSLAAFKYMPIVVIAIVVIVCVAPLCVFWSTLVRTRRRGIFEYGTLAISMGRQFEHKWLVDPAQARDGALEEPDFSATTDLYSIVANVQAMTPFPIEKLSLIRLAIAALAPAIPLAFIALPFNVIMEHIIKLLL